MLLFLKKKPEDIDKIDIAASAPVFSDFIPYYCHYDSRTLLTKNGELMQIVKIASNTRGLDYESGETEEATVRETIRAAIMGAVESDKLSIWIHTIRKRKSVRHAAQLPEAFAGYVHDHWLQKNRWKYQYYNEIYVTLLYEGQSTEMFNKRTLPRVFMPKRNRQYRNEYFEAAHTELDRTVSRMLDKIRVHYNAHRLSIVERIPTHTESSANKPVFYSEPMEFLGTLLNLRAENFLLPDQDISTALCTHNLTFGFNAMETRNVTGKRRFGAVLTLKQYREIPLEATDRIMQAPMEFIISQTFNFIPSGNALEQYKAQKELFDISGDLPSIRETGIEEMLLANKNKPTDFGEQQTSIMVLVDDYRQLDEEVIKVQNDFAELGLITIREDVKLEECFWAQLPGNFEFIRRKDPINTGKVGGFCRLNRFPNGAAAGNHWGDAVALVPTVVQSPYFFNFHHHDNGNTIFLDFNSFNDQGGNVLLNFLLTEARKYKGKLYIFDRNRSAQLYFDKLGGDYHTLPVLPNLQGHRRLQLNPFTLEDTPRNRSFLVAWCTSLISTDLTLPDRQKDILSVAISRLYTLPPEERHFESLLAHVSTADPALARSFADWHGRGKYAGMIDATTENFDMNHLVHAFDMTTVTAQPRCIIPIFSYLLHRIISSLDGRPTIIALHEAADLLENAFFAPRLESLLEMLKQNNVMVIFTSSNPSDFANSPVASVIVQSCATQLFVPDDIALNYVAKGVGLSDYDARLLRRMERQKGEFLLRQNGESIALRVDMTSLDDIRAILANDIKNMVAAGGKFSSLPQTMD